LEHGIRAKVHFAWKLNAGRRPYSMLTPGLRLEARSEKSDAGKTNETPLETKIEQMLIKARVTIPGGRRYSASS
jgi:hypothetical protein